MVLSIKQTETLKIHYRTDLLPGIGYIYLSRIDTRYFNNLYSFATLFTLIVWRIDTLAFCMLTYFCATEEMQPRLIYISIEMFSRLYLEETNQFLFHANKNLKPWRFFLQDKLPATNRVID